LLRGIGHGPAFEIEDVGEVEGLDPQPEAGLQGLGEVGMLGLGRHQQLADRHERELAIHQVERALDLEPQSFETVAEIARRREVRAADLYSAREDQLLLEVDREQARFVPGKKQREAAIGVLPARGDIALGGFPGCRPRTAALSRARTCRPASG